MRRTIGWMAAICCGWFTVSANAAQPAIQKTPNDAPQTLPAMPQTAAPGQPIIIQGPVTIMTNNPAPAPAPKRPRIIHKVVGFAGRYFTPEHWGEPDGIPSPVGCSNAYTEFKFAFGSATQFFGSADATRGHLGRTTVPPPNSR